MGFKQYGHVGSGETLRIDTSPECALAMDSNPCYEASNVKPTEIQEVHIYETV